MNYITENVKYFNCFLVLQYKKMLYPFVSKELEHHRSVIYLLSLFGDAE